MSPSAYRILGMVCRAPRVSGDEPALSGFFNEEVTCSPRERG